MPIDRPQPLPVPMRAPMPAAIYLITFALPLLACGSSASTPSSGPKANRRVESVVSQPRLAAASSDPASARNAPPARRMPLKQAAPAQVRVGEGNVLDRLKRLRTRNRALVPPSPSLALSYRRWVAQVLAAAHKGAAAPAALEGFALEAFDDGRLWLLSEAPERRWGGGAVLLRVGAARALSIQAPHTYFDAGSLPIGYALFERTSARAFMINTVHRAAGVPDDKLEAVIRAGKAPADVAHIESSLFTEAHRALLAGEPRLLTVQIHGYSDERLPGIDAVLSASRSKLTGLDGLADRLSETLAMKFAAYPRDTKDLGGTRNRQAIDCRVHGRPFLHMELSVAVRTRARHDPALIDALAEQITLATGGRDRAR